MRRLIFFMILAASLLLNVGSSIAQRTFSTQRRPILKMDDQGVCRQSPPLGLTEHQMKALENLQQTFIAEATPLRRELMSLRFDLRHLIRDQNVPSKTLFERQRKISELQAKLDNLAVSYQMEVRSILTKEQLERLPEDCLLGIESGFGMDAGTRRRVWKGFLR
jgi:Spy/CpxP family protein refolding chaperone